MPKLKNESHEAFAQNMAAGMANGTAYCAAYPDCPEKSAPASATRLLKNAKIQARITELQEKAFEAVKQAISFEARAQFERLEATICKAEEAGEFKVAIDARIRVLAMFGYEDFPTLTQEHVNNRSVVLAGQGAAQSDEDVIPIGAEVASRFSRTLKEMNKKLN